MAQEYTLKYALESSAIWGWIATRTVDGKPFRGHGSTADEAISDCNHQEARDRRKAALRNLSFTLTPTSGFDLWHASCEWEGKKYTHLGAADPTQAVEGCRKLVEKVLSQ